MIQSYTCPKCAAPVLEGATACPSCGYVRPPLAGTRRPMPAQTNQKAIASAVLSTLGLVIPFAAGLAAIVLSFAARKDLRARPEIGGRTLAGIGFWLGLAGVASWTYIALRIAAR